jgi:FixJ family two-component response regulator
MSERTPVVFVVEDERVVREAIDSLLRSAGYPVKSFLSARELFAELTSEDSGCLVLDVRLPGMSGLEFQQELNRVGISIPIIFVTGYGDIRMSVQAIKAGAVEFLTKPINDDDLLNAVAHSLEKDRVDRQQRTELAKIQQRFSMLTPREREVMQFVVSGLLNKQIAAEVGISEITVKIHRAHVMRKMEVHSLAELAQLAQRMTLAPDGLTHPS